MPAAARPHSIPFGSAMGRPFRVGSQHRPLPDILADPDAALNAVLARLGLTV